MQGFQIVPAVLLVAAVAASLLAGAGPSFAQNPAPVPAPAPAPPPAPAPSPAGSTAWGRKLSEPYEQWKPLKDVLKELAGRAGAEVSFAQETKVTFVAPLPAGITLKEAVEKAAATCGFEAVVEGNGVTVRKGGRIPGWVDMAGGRGVAVIEGNVRGGIDLPRNVDANRPIPWVWYAPNGLGPYHAWLAKRLFEQGVALASVNVGESQGNPAGRAIFTRFHEILVSKHGMAKKPVLFPQSRGGLMLYNSFNFGGFANEAYWFVLPPGICIIIVVLGFTFVSYALDEIMNPRLRRR